MKSVKKENNTPSVKVKTDEQMKKTTNAELVEELGTKKSQLKDAEARLNGGFSPGAQRELLAIDDELEKLGRFIEMRELEVQYEAPMESNCKYRYESNARWRELRKSFIQEEVAQMKEQRTNIEKQKESVLKDIPLLQARINELQKQLGQKPTDFKQKKEKADYIG